MDASAHSSLNPHARLKAVAQGIAVVAILGLLVWSAWRDWPKGWAPMLTLRPAELVAGTVSAVLALVGLAGLFAATVRAGGAFDARHVPYYFRIWLQSYFFRYFPAKLLLVGQRIALGRRVGISPAQGLLFVLLETALLLLAGGLVLLALLPFTGQWGSLNHVIATIAALLAALVLSPRLMRWVFATRVVRRRLGDLRTLPGWRAQVALIGGYAAVWVLLSVASFCAARVVHPLPWSDLPQFAFCFVGAYVLGLVAAIAPAGLGVREVALAAGLSTLVPLPVATTLAFASRLHLTAAELVTVALAVVTVQHPPLSTHGNDRASSER